MTTLAIKDNTLIIQLSFMEKVLAMQLNLTINLADIVKTESIAKNASLAGAKIKGTRMGSKIYGTFKADDDKNFWAVDNQEHVLCITLTSQQKLPFAKLYIGVDDVEQWKQKLKK